MFAELEEDIVDLLVGFSNLFSRLGSCKDDFTASVDEKDDLGGQIIRSTLHLVDQPWEELRLVVTFTELDVLCLQLLKFDAKANVARRHHILNLKRGQIYS